MLKTISPKMYSTVPAKKECRVLIFADWFDPGNRGGGLTRSCVNVARLLSNTHEVYVITRNHDLNITEPYNGVISDEWVDFEEGIKVYYCSKNNLSIRTIQDQITYVEPDLLYLNSLYSYYFSLVPMWLNYRNLIDSEIILAPRGMLHAGALKFKALKKKTFLWLVKKSNLFGDIRFHATSETEKDNILNHFPDAEISMIQDLPSYEPRIVNPSTKSKGILDCLFLSRITPKKNLTFLLKQLKNARENIHLTIAGGIDDHDYWTQCQSIIKQLPDNINVEYAGIIPHESISALFAKAHLLLLPTFGENFGHVIFESLMHATPVLISDQTPWSELENDKAGWSFNLSDPDRFLNIIDCVADMDQIQYNNWSKGARVRGLDYLNNPDFINAYIDLFQSNEKIYNLENESTVDYILKPVTANP